MLRNSANLLCLASCKALEWSFCGFDPFFNSECCLEIGRLEWKNTIGADFLFLWLQEKRLQLGVCGSCGQPFSRTEKLAEVIHATSLQLWRWHMETKQVTWTKSDTHVLAREVCRCQLLPSQRSQTRSELLRSPIGSEPVVADLAREARSWRGASHRPYGSSW